MQYWLTCPMGVKSDPTVKSGACTLYRTQPFTVNENNNKNEG